MNIENPPADIRKSQRLLTLEQSAGALYIDFEGVGRTADDPVPLPHLLGTYTPKAAVRTPKYLAYLFRLEWQPVANGVTKDAVVADFNKTIETLIGEAERSNRPLVYWSDHERAIIEAHCPTLHERFCQMSLNLLPPVRRMINRLGIVQPEQTPPSSLAEFMSLLFPQNTEISEITPGPAESCRRIDATRSANRRWRNWSTAQKELAIRLLDYNLADCRSTWRLARKLANHLATRRLADTLGVEYSDTPDNVPTS